MAASDSSIGGDEGFQRAAVEAAEAFQPTELDRVFGDESRWKLESAAAAAVVVAAAAVAATAAAVAVEIEEEGVFFVDEVAVFGMPGLLANLYFNI